jgi:hypothetical protein
MAFAGFERPAVARGAKPAQRQGAAQEPARLAEALFAEVLLAEEQGAVWQRRNQREPVR